MISYRFVPISSQKGGLFFETPGIFKLPIDVCSREGWRCCGAVL